MFQARSSVRFGESLAKVLHLIRQMPESPSLIPEEHAPNPDLVLILS